MKTGAGLFIGSGEAADRAEPDPRTHAKYAMIPVISSAPTTVSRTRARLREGRGSFATIAGFDLLFDFFFMAHRHSLLVCG
jgi:hypothetical protein